MHDRDNFAAVLVEDQLEEDPNNIGYGSSFSICYDYDYRYTKDR